MNREHDNLTKNIDFSKTETSLCCDNHRSVTNVFSVLCCLHLKISCQKVGFI